MKLTEKVKGSKKAAPSTVNTDDGSEKSSMSVYSGYIEKTICHKDGFVGKVTNATTDGESVSEFRIECTISEFSPNEAKNFIEYLSFEKEGDAVKYYLHLHYRAWKEGSRKIFQELKIGDSDDSISMDGIDPIRGRKIRLCTIHAVKGQKHDATLFLETEKNRGSDLARILWCYGIGKPGVILSF